MNTKVTNSINRKTEFAFSAIMFFAPLIKNNIKNNQKLTQEEKIFISWFIKLWYINIILLVIAIILWIIWFRTNNIIIQRVDMWVLIFLSILLVIWTILAALDKNLWSINDLKNLDWKADFNKILYFIPLYNIYIWYRNHQFEWENGTIKCGIFFLAIFVLCAVFIRSMYVNLSILALVLLIMICGINWISLWTRRDKFFNEVFVKNPEEIWWYVSGLLLSLFNRKWLKNNIDGQKKQFEFLFKIDNKQIIFEYILLWLLCASGICVWIIYWEYSLLMWNILIVLRYFMMAIKWKHLPHLPIFRWISSIFFRFNKTTDD